MGIGSRVIHQIQRDSNVSQTRDLESRFREFEKSDFYDSKFVFTGDCIERKGKLSFAGIILTLVPLGFLIPGLLFISEPPAIFGISLIAIGGIGFLFTSRGPSVLRIYEDRLELTTAWHNLGGLLVKQKMWDEVKELAIHEQINHSENTNLPDTYLVVSIIVNGPSDRAYAMLDGEPKWGVAIYSVVCNNWTEAQNLTSGLKQLIPIDLATIEIKKRKKTEVSV